MNFALDPPAAGSCLHLPCQSLFSNVLGERTYCIFVVNCFLLSLRPLLAVSTRIVLCKWKENGEKGNVAWLRASFHLLALHLKCLLWQCRVAGVGRVGVWGFRMTASRRRGGEEGRLGQREKQWRQGVGRGKKWSTIAFTLHSMGLQRDADWTLISCGSSAMDKRGNYNQPKCWEAWSEIE